MVVRVEAPAEGEDHFARRRDGDAPEDRLRVEAEIPDEERHERCRGDAEGELRREAVAVEEEDRGHERGRCGNPGQEAALHVYGCRAGRWRRLAMVIVSVDEVIPPSRSVAVTVTV